MNSLRTRLAAGEFKLPDGSADRIGLMKEFAKLYQSTCTQQCPHCFNQEDSFYVDKILSGQKLMRWSETKELLTEAKRFGLESVKFLGIGELLKNLDMFEVLDDLKELGLHVGIFTKGTALGENLVSFFTS